VDPAAPLSLQQAKHPATGLSGGQLSYRTDDRAQAALGHVHPAINEAKIVASYHQTNRYHDLPLAQMQAACTLIEKAAPTPGSAGLDSLGLRRLEDLRPPQLRSECGVFVTLMTDGTRIQWQESRKGYYIADSFAPCRPDGFILWGYAWPTG